MTTGTVMLEHVIPTYDPEGEGDKEYDMSRPATVVVKEDLGLRILLGPDSPDTPDLMLEKGVDCWRLFVHAQAGGDPSRVVEIRENSVVIADARGKETDRDEF
jgi:hypothetical protein